MDRLFNLIKEIGHDSARSIVDSQIIYPRTSDLQYDQAMFTGEFEETLTDVITKIQNSIELKAVDAVGDAISILKLMEECKNSILLSKADLVVVYKGGFDILKLENRKYPQSGRSIYIEINSCRNELIRKIQNARDKEVPWLNVLIGVSVLMTLLLQLKK